MEAAMAVRMIGPVGVQEGEASRLFSGRDGAAVPPSRVSVVAAGRGTARARAIRAVERTRAAVRAQEVKDAGNRSSSVDALLDSLKWDDKGLVVAIAQNLDTGAIMMQGFANRDAVAATIMSQKATFFSRSRSSLWTKGETSSNFIHVHDIFIDCDRDSVIYLGKPDGPSCHTGAETCYYTSVSDILRDTETEERLAMTTLYSLENTISHRRDETRAADEKPSWTKRLLSNQDLLCSKVREEAEELVQTLQCNEDRSRVASEMADLLYHAMVLLSVRHVKTEEVFEVLRKRFSQSGIEEKKSRKNSSN